MAQHATACRAGCDACCHHLVPITPSEATRLREVAADLPAVTRAAVTHRLEDNLERLDEAGLLELLRDLESAPADGRAWLAEAYAAEKVACPFLEDGRCVIYDERPTACRAHASRTDCRVSTPELVRLAGRPVVRALAELDEAEWLPLVLFRENTAANPARRSMTRWTAAFAEQRHDEARP